MKRCNNIGRENKKNKENKSIFTSLFYLLLESFSPFMNFLSMILDDDVRSDSSQDSTSTDICEIALNNERREWKMMPLESPFMRELESLLMEIYEALKPKPIHYEQRKMLVDVFNTMSVDVFGQNEGFPIVEEFGSFKMDLFTSESDLDLSVNFSDEFSCDYEYPRDKKIAVMRKLSKVLYKHQKQGNVRGVLPVLTARVPVLKLVDCGTNVEIDVSVENKDGIFRSNLISLVCEIDERFRILSYLVKMWAKANNINSSRDRTISSMTIITLVAFHLQTRNPPILPPFYALFKDGMNIPSIEKRIPKFKNFGSGNKESIAKLFLSLICKLKSVQELWEDGLCASCHEGSWIRKKWGRNANITAAMGVEDFLDRSENFARSVGRRKEMKKINTCTQNTLNYSIRFLSGQINPNKFKTYIFGPIFSNNKLPPVLPPAQQNENKIFTWDDIPVLVPPAQQNNNNNNDNYYSNNKRKYFDDKSNVEQKSRYRNEVVPGRYIQLPAGKSHFGPIVGQPNPSFSHLNPNPSFSQMYSERQPNPSFYEPNPNLFQPNPYLFQPNPSFSHAYYEPQQNPSFSHLYRETRSDPSFSHLNRVMNPNPNFSHRYSEPERRYSFDRQNFRR